MANPSDLLKWLLGDSIKDVSFVEVPLNTPYVYKPSKTKPPKVEPWTKLGG